MKLALLASTIFAATGLASPIEAHDKHLISYTFERNKNFMESDLKVQKIIVDATGMDDWICSRSFPPICHPPPLETDVIKKLEALPGVIIRRTVRECTST
ncbi:hypothetical protein JDV02_003547 [Purpureocillium takamizusanense]|uniref:Uncharacterized protein n=1 Tax=Purpureocillium takamizusanense TaxID=2060973 RepID=A0A9Q8QDB5_9HYPO|nr:uncharacterized protein JDV02_003547 [Purpureocillium takamizusanense]UNI17172.1 hypothetical protein JDV02_003547 [Purpureocillium takamizusanense]